MHIYQTMPFCAHSGHPPAYWNIPEHSGTSYWNILEDSGTYRDPYWNIPEDSGTFRKNFFRPASRVG